ncbi:MAG: hypothetical protein BWX92_02316 [Deltaproteobacteria bacterium ADurb.Bin135]|nr:MAG: hypothetical protein BWX92_02316 [Deltaproteobacteria bacterium ADurb.Bin135]
MPSVGDDTGNKLLYFAYGSNMLSKRLRAPSRTPSALFLDTGFVEGRKLTFDKLSSDGSGKCDIESTGNPSDKVYGVLYEIIQSEKTALDKAEGLGKGYEEQAVAVITPSGPHKAIAYVGTSKKPDLKPFHWYKELVVAGAIEHLLPEEYVQNIRAVESKPDTNTERCREQRELLKG